MTLLRRFIIAFLLFSGTLFAQSDTTVYNIFWNKPVSLVFEGKYKDIISFDLADHKRANQYLPSYNLIVKARFSSSFELINAEWSGLNEQDLKSLPEKYDIGSDPRVSLYNSEERGTYNTKIEIVPLRRNLAGSLEKLVKFQIKLLAGSAPFLSQNNERVQRRMSSLSNSVLSQGEWYKLSFSNTGIYKIDFKFLKSIGLNPDQINTQNLQIWGNGGGMLPEKNSAPRKVDLTETPIFINDGNDGKFDENDYILFYAQGPDVWKPDVEEPYFSFSKHLYSRQSYYFLTVGNSSGKRVLKEASIPTNPEKVFSTYTSRAYHEVDRANFLFSGRKWYGEEFDINNVQSFNIPVNRIAGGSAIYVKSSFMNRSSQPFTINTFDLSLNNLPFKTYSIYGGGTGIYDRIGSEGEYMDFMSSDNLAGQNKLALTIRYNKNAGVGTGYLDYFSIAFEDELIVNTNYTDFRNIGSINKGVVQYNLKLSLPSQIHIWNVTDIGNISEPFADVTDNAATFKYLSDTTLSEFVAFYGDNFPGPDEGQKISNQNVRGNTTPDLLIVTYPLFKNQANKLADFRREHDNMEVVVATTEEIYNEFSSGAQDLAAIRDCARMFYLNSDNNNLSKFKYILLFGDCSYDYKNIRNLNTPQSFIPIYESEESLLPTESYSSDDYIGLLGPLEGEWDGNDDLEVGIGRLPVRTPEEAEGVVQKLIHYSTDPATLGSWRQNLTFLADNEEGNEFLDNAEELSASKPVSNPSPSMQLLKKNYNSKKIYLAAYNKDFSGETPDANRDIANEFENGTFILNYVGHGGEKQLASENIINLNTISSLRNYDKLPFLVTATCDFGKYDDPSITSGGELFVLNPYGGSIGMLCTTRPVFQNYNRKINRAFYDNVFSQENGSFLHLGELIRLSKNASVSNVFNRNFALLGDPSLKLAYPENSISLTKINDKEFKPFSDTLKAQSKVTISGNISKNGTVLNNFNGVVNILVFDKEFQIETIEDPKVSFNVRESKIFDGSATVKNGEFTFTFIVPKSINYIIGAGKISLYANVEDGRIVDAGGGDSQILIGGSEKNVAPDNTPPQVKAYLNDESFVQNGITNENPLLIVKLYDENGISSIGDIGGSITAVINNKTNDKKNLNSYYKSDRDTYKSGTIRYPLSNLEEGPNTIKIEAFDTNKNGLENGGIIDFIVAKRGNLTIKHLINYPNPFTTNTVFHFDHNRAGDDLDIMLQVFTITGKLVKSLNLHSPAAPTHISDLVWDGKDDYGDNIGRGVYVYKLSVKALSDGFKKDEYQKLVILN